MPIPTPTRPANATADSQPPEMWAGRGKPGRSPRWPRASGRKRVPYVVVGAVLVVVCAAGGIVAASQLAGRESILVLARPMTVGQDMSTQDLRQVSVSTDSGLDVIPAVAESTVLGEPVAYSLPAGAILTSTALGQARVPTAGQAETAVGLKPGQFPPDLAAGARVAVLVTPTSATGAATGTSSTGSSSSVSSWTATVTTVAPSSQGDGTTVVSLQLPQASALQVAAAAASGISLVVLSGGGN